MGDPDHPLPPDVYRGDCQKDATYIVTKGGVGKWDVPNGTPYPVVVEGGDGNDTLTVTGHGQKGVIVDGGAGNDHITVSTQSEATFLGTLSDRLLYYSVTTGDNTPLLLAAAFVVTMVAVAVLGLRALSGPRH